MRFGIYNQWHKYTDLTGFFSDIITYLNTFKILGYLDIENGFGYTLDLCGKIIGVDRRPVLVRVNNMVWNEGTWNLEDWGNSVTPIDELLPMSDVTFKKLLEIRSQQLLFPRTINNTLELLDTILPNLIFTYANSENQFIINFQGTSATDEEEAILLGNYILAPQSCNLVINKV